MKVYKEIEIEVRCPNCQSKNVKAISGCVLVWYPPFEPFQCVDCEKEFHSQSFKIEPFEESNEND